MPHHLFPFFLTLWLLFAASSVWAQNPGSAGERLEVVLQEGHGEHIFDLAMHPRLPLLASSSSNLGETVLIWDTQSGLMRHALRGLAAQAIAFHPDQPVLAVGTMDGVSFWNAETGAQEDHLPGDNATPLEALAYLPDGRLLTAGSGITLWEQNRPVRTLPVSPEHTYFTAVAASPDGRWIAAAAVIQNEDETKGAIYVWETVRFEAAQVLPVKGWVHALAFSHDGARLAAAHGTGSEGTVVLWRIPEGQVLLETSLNSVNQVGFTPDSRILLAAGNFEQMERWNVATGAKLGSIRGIRTFATESSGPFVASTDGTNIQFWPREVFGNGTEHRLLRPSGGSPVGGISLDPERKILYTREGYPYVTESRATTGPHVLRRWDLASGTETAHLVLPESENEIRDLAIAPDGRLLATPLDDAVLLLDPATLTPVDTLRGAGWRTAAPHFSPDGQFLAAAGSQLAVWSRAEGEWTQAPVLLLESEAWDLAFTSDSRTLAAVVEVGDEPYIRTMAVVFVDTQAWNRQELQIPVPGSSIPKSAISPDNRYLAVTVFGSDTLTVVSLSDRAALRLPITGAINDLAFDPTGTVLYATGLFDGIQRWSLPSGRSLAPLTDTQAYHYALDRVFVSPDGQQIVAAMSNDSTVVLTAFDNSSGILRDRMVWPLKHADRTPLFEHVTAGTWDLEGLSVLVALGDGSLHQWHLTPETPAVVIEPLVQPIRSLAYHEATKRLLLTRGGEYGDWDQLQLWDLRTATLLHTFPAPPDGGTAYALSPDGNLIAEAHTGRSASPMLRVWHAGTLELIHKQELTAQAQALAFHPQRPLLAIGQIGEKTPLLLDLETGSERPGPEAPAPPYHLAFSPDGAYLLTTTYDNLLTLWTTETGEKKWERSLGSHSMQPVFHTDGRRLAASADGYLVLLDLEDGATIQEFQSTDTSYLVATAAFSLDGRTLAASPTTSIDDGRLVHLWEVETSAHIGTLTGHKRGVTGLAFDGQGRLLSSGLDYGIRYWDVAAKAERLRLIPVGTSDYAVLTPDPFYKASKEARRGIAFRRGHRLFPFEQFDLQRNRPDLVLAELGTEEETLAAYREAYARRLTQTGVDENPALPATLPTLRIPDLPAPLTDADLLPLRLVAAGTEAPLKHLEVFVNDVPLFGSAGRRVAPHPTLDTTLAVPLGRGQNKIQVAVRDARGVASMHETFTVTRQAPFRKPDLYVLAVGVSDYVQDGYDLTYAASDADSVLHFFARQRGRYGTVHTRRITDGDATRATIESARAFLMQASVDDHVVVFFAGHGLLDEDDTYYFATTDIDFENPSGRGLPYASLEGLLDGLQARQKLMLIDTCHSGEIAGEPPVETTAEDGTRGQVVTRSTRRRTDRSASADATSRLARELFADLRRGTGAMVISASGAAEFAFEAERWSNGVFTFALLHGLQTGQADLNRDGHVTVSELQAYVSREVLALTDGRQTPNLRRENLVLDFVVY